MAFMSLLTFMSFVISTFLLYVLYGAIYRLYLSPIAKFPGRRLAALTMWYEFYFDIIKHGNYTWEIKKMHEEYGPIVRINPYELHITDPSFMTQLYPNVAKNVEKWEWSVAMFGNVDMAFSTANHHLHRVRRRAFSKFFSKQSINRLEPTIQVIVDNLCMQLIEYQESGKPANLSCAYTALAYDTITNYCFADCKNLVLQPNFGEGEADLVSPGKFVHMIKHFPRMLPMMNAIPDWIIEIINPLAASFRTSIRRRDAQIDKIFKEDEEEKATALNQSTIFHSLRDEPELPAKEKSPARLSREAQSLIGAGTFTSAHMLATTTYHVLSNTHIFEKLLAELERAFPDPSVSPRYVELEKLPYLSAVIIEGLRIFHGVTHRLQRVYPDQVLQYNEWAIPPGTPVGMTSVLIQEDPVLFPSPLTFDPERWLQPNSQELTKYIFAFGKGTRQCVGMNLAYAEMYLTLAAVFRKFGRQMELFDTDRERDVDVTRDFFIGHPSLESKGVRVAIRK